MSWITIAFLVAIGSFLIWLVAQGLQNYNYKLNARRKLEAAGERLPRPQAYHLSDDIEMLPTGNESEIEPPSVFDELRIKADLQLLQDNPSLLHTYLDKLARQFRNKQQRDSIESWTNVLGSAEKLYVSSGNFRRAEGKSKKVDDELRVEDKKRQAEVAQLEAQVAEAELRAQQARGEIERLKIPPAAPVEKLTKDQERIIRREEARQKSANLKHLKADDIAARTGKGDVEEQIRRAENQWDQKIEEAEQEYFKWL